VHLEFYRMGPTPGGPWSEPLPLRPGWAHEVWQDAGGQWYASYLTNYSVAIAEVWWNRVGGVVMPGLEELFPRLIPLVISNSH
jgi:hypothetical protein